MRIKRLEIQGFKSFKDKTVVYFDRPITGIVGPNGSGKSNIVDAFFWVMGEQSYKHIRSSGSDDLIFKGSSKYQPLGMAEVTLVMEQDYVDPETAPMGASAEAAPQVKKREISVSRRVYRSGEGEYFINGIQSRLKDIQELFLDTGVGAKGYSVIEQGQIDKVVNSKPEDRRLLIEDAAGIAKYKQRKKESLRKLDSANVNLDRITDVLSEIERSLNSLERQAQKAKRYKEYRAELLEKETTWGRRRNQVLRRKLKTIEEQQKNFDQVLSGVRAELSQNEVDLETHRTIQLTDSKASEEIQNTVETLAAELAHHQSALQLSQKRKEDLDRQVTQLSAENDQIEQDLSHHEQLISEKDQALSGIDEVVSDLSSEADVLGAKVNELREVYHTGKREAESKRREFVGLTTESTQSHSKIAALEERISGANAQLARIAEIETQTHVELEQIEAERSKVTETFETRSADQDALRERLELGRTQLQQIENEAKIARQSRDLAMKELARLSSRLKSLEDLEKTREGMTNGPRKVLEWAESNGKSFSVLSDFIEVESGYDQAVEAVLGHTFERLYVQDSDAAFSALQFLRETQEGSAAIQIAVPNLESVERATYNPLRKFIKLITPSGYTNENSTAVHQLVEALVSSIEVLEEVPADGDIETYQAEKISFVTKNGIWFDANQGVLFGGTVESDQAGSLLARKRMIQELSTQVETAETELNTIEAKVEQLAESFEVAQSDLRMLQTQASEIEIEVGTLKAQKEQIHKKMSELEQVASRIQDDREKAKQIAQEAGAEIEETRSLIQEMTARKTELENWIVEHEGGLNERDEALRSVEDQYQSLRVQLASEAERKNSLTKELETERRYSQDRQKRLDEVQRLLETFTRDREEYAGGDSEHEEALHTVTRQLSEKREALAEIRDRLELANAEVSSKMDRIRELHKMNEDKGHAMNQLAIEVERVQADLEHLIENMEEKYGEGCLQETQGQNHQEEMDDPIVTPEINEEEERMMGELVDELREKIRRLGEVNTMAVEEYEDMQKRHEHLFQEKKDLEQSIDNLNEAIEHINKTSEERFGKAFEAIQVRFEKLFPIIFGGGQARLSLVYPEGSEDILDAGVDILAQPPGKKISNMSLLSGGEKALTAISLIFAIFMVKPSPFCILDEVDAPLDDSNIGKFNALVREMSAKSQFILVTHNKKTMELNDALYGVTMEEPGVSRMVSIELQ